MAFKGYSSTFVCSVAEDVGLPQGKKIDLVPSR